MTPRGDGGPPHPNRWAEREPAAAVRLTKARAAIAALAEKHVLPAENVVEPALVRRLAWEPPPDVRAALSEGGARPWQIELVSQLLVGAFAG